MDHAIVRLLKIVSMIGMGLSFFGVVLMLGIRIEESFWMPRTSGASAANAFRHVLDGLKESGIALLLASLLYVACVIAQRIPTRPTRDAD